MSSKPSKVVVIGVAGDSGCGKSTFLRRLNDLFGEEFMTVICLDDYHSLDRKQRKVTGITALNPRANNFDLMYEQVKALKEGKSVWKPIYNHETGLLDPPELIHSNKVIVIEGLHPIYDERVRDLLDFSIYLDLSDEIKVAWKIQRDMAERGHNLDDVKQAIATRKPDFEAYIDPQKAHADVVIQILPTKLIPNDADQKVMRVRLIQRNITPNSQGNRTEDLAPAYLFDEGSTITWIPCGTKLTCSYPGIKLFSGPDSWCGQPVSVLEIDGQFDRLEEMVYIENHLSCTGSKYYGELTELLRKHPDYPGSNNGTGLLQIIAGLKMRAIFERINQHEEQLVAV